MEWFTVTVTHPETGESWETGFSHHWSAKRYTQRMTDHGFMAECTPAYEPRSLVEALQEAAIVFDAPEVLKPKGN